MVDRLVRRCRPRQIDRRRKTISTRVSEVIKEIENVEARSEAVAGAVTRITADGIADLVIGTTRNPGEGEIVIHEVAATQREGRGVEMIGMKALAPGGAVTVAVEMTMKERDADERNHTPRVYVVTMKERDVAGRNHELRVYRMTRLGTGTLRGMVTTERLGTVTLTKNPTATCLLLMRAIDILGLTGTAAGMEEGITREIKVLETLTWIGAGDLTGMWIVQEIVL